MALGPPLWSGISICKPLQFILDKRGKYNKHFGVFISVFVFVFCIVVVFANKGRKYNKWIKSFAPTSLSENIVFVYLFICVFVFGGVAVLRMTSLMHLPAATCFTTELTLPWSRPCHFSLFSFPWFYKLIAVMTCHPKLKSHFPSSSSNQD